VNKRTEEQESNHMMNIDLHIEELILHGFAAPDRARIAAAVERELGRMLAERGAPQSWAQHPNSALLNGGSFTVAPGATPDAIGVQVAQAIYSSGSGQSLAANTGAPSP
jgi:hypothetical protein